MVKEVDDRGRGRGRGCAMRRDPSSQVPERKEKVELTDERKYSVEWTKLKRRPKSKTGAL